MNKIKDHKSQNADTVKQERNLLILFMVSALAILAYIAVTPNNPSIFALVGISIVTIFVMAKLCITKTGKSRNKSIAGFIMKPKVDVRRP